VKKKLILVVIAALVLVLTGGYAEKHVLAGGGDGSNPKFVILDEGISVQIANPFNVVWGAAKLYINNPGKNIVLWPGQKIASVPVTIENKSPYRYSAQIFASSIKGDWSNLQVQISSTKNVQIYGSAINIDAGQTVTANIDVSVSTGIDQWISFQGLQLQLSQGPPVEEGKG